MKSTSFDSSGSSKARTTTRVDRAKIIKMIVANILVFLVQGFEMSESKEALIGYVPDPCIGQAIIGDCGYPALRGCEGHSDCMVSRKVRGDCEST
jgi:hypothetical protein